MTSAAIFSYCVFMKAWYAQLKNKRRTFLRVYNPMVCFINYHEASGDRIAADRHAACLCRLV